MNEIPLQSNWLDINTEDVGAFSRDEVIEETYEQCQQIVHAWNSELEGVSSLIAYEESIEDCLKEVRRESDFAEGGDVAKLITITAVLEARLQTVKWYRRTLMLTGQIPEPPL